MLASQIIMSIHGGILYMNCIFVYSTHQMPRRATRRKVYMMKHLLSIIVIVGAFFAINAALLSKSTVRAGNISQPTVDAWGTFSQIVAGNWHTCALNATGDVYCWGNHYYGTAGVGDFNILISGQKYDSPQAASMPSGITFSSITGGANHNC